jgi:rhodanese-related sulfurtransferase
VDNFFCSREGFYDLKASDLNTELSGETQPLVVDLRTGEEVAGGYIEGSVHIPINELLADMTLLPSDKAAPVVLVCQSGHRGGIGLVALRSANHSSKPPFSVYIF